MDIEQAKKCKDLSNKIGEQLFNMLVQTQERVNKKVDDDDVADTVVRDAAQSAFASFLGNSIIYGKGIKDTAECQKICDDINEKIGNVVHDILLESGAKIMAIDWSDEDQRSGG